MEYYINQTLVIVPGNEEIPSYYALEKQVALNFLITYYDRDPSFKDVDAMVNQLNKYDILIYHFDACDFYGCGAVSWMLLKHKKTKKLYENRTVCCSCDGLAFHPEETTVKYLLSDNLGLFGTAHPEDEECIISKSIKDKIKEYVRINLFN